MQFNCIAKAGKEASLLRLSVYDNLYIIFPFVNANAKIVPTPFMPCVFPEWLDCPSNRLGTSLPSGADVSVPTRVDSQRATLCAAICSFQEKVKVNRLIG